MCVCVCVCTQVKLQELYLEVCQKYPKFIEKVPHLPELPGERIQPTFLPPHSVSFTLPLLYSLSFIHSVSFTLHPNSLFILILGKKNT